MTNRIGMTLRMGAAYDELTVRGTNGQVEVFDRAGMHRQGRTILRKQVHKVRAYNATVE